MLYEYKAKATDVYDGDTITVDIDLGFGIWMRRQKIRLRGIDAPEVRGLEKEAGLKSRDRVRELILGALVTLRTYKDSKEKYGRWLAEVYYMQKPYDPAEVLLNKQLLDENLVVAMEG